MEVYGTDEFARWYEGLAIEQARAVDRVVSLLALQGVRLGFPHASALRGSRHALRELRVRSGRRHLRVIYAFDPDRDVVLLIGGDKTGSARFYEVFIPWADRILEGYLREQATGLHRDEEDP